MYLFLDAFDFKMKWQIEMQRERKEEEGEESEKEKQAQLLWYLDIIIVLRTFEYFLSTILRRI